MRDKFGVGDRVVIDDEAVAVVTDVILEESEDTPTYKVSNLPGVITEDRIKLYLED